MAFDSEIQYLLIIIIIGGWPFVPFPGHPPWDDVGYRVPAANIFLVIRTGLLASTALFYPEEFFSLKFGPFALLPAFKLLVDFVVENLPEKEKKT